MKTQLSIGFFFFFIMALFAAPSSPSAGQQSTGPDQSPASEKQSTRPTNEQSGGTKGNAAGAQDATKRDKDDVVRISVTLVQVDAVVTDGKGRYITDLQPDDFEIFEDGKRQHITNFSYVSTPSASPVNPPQPSKTDKNAPPGPPVRLRPEQVRRTIALVVDDLGLSFESTAMLRYVLKEFVDQQMQPGDLVAIIRTGAGMGALQQFTPDKRLLNAAIERIRWNPLGRGGISAFVPIASGPLQLRREEATEGYGAARGTNSSGADQSGERESLERLREDLFAVGTLGAVNYIVRGLRELPGRKSVILFSEGFTIFLRQQHEINNRVYDALRRLTDIANRASVIIYTIDPRGLQALGLDAADNTSGLSPTEVVEQLQARRDQLFDSQEGLHYLADQTGGFFIGNTNDLNRGIRRVLDDQQGYYLLGYVPEASSFRTTRGVTPFHKISVKLKRAGLHVRSRTGFYGFSDETPHLTPGQQLLAALTSPFASGDIHLRLTSIFGYDQKIGAFMRSILNVDPSQINFTKEADGQYKALIDIFAFTFGDNGQVIDHKGREYTIRVPENTLNKIMREGILYNLTVPIKKPGAYQLRVAVRDAASEKIGSANQFIEVPDVGKKRLALSGIVLEGSDPAKQRKPAEARAVNSTEGATEESDPQSGPSMRLLRAGMELNYAFVIYNATVDSASGKPQLESQVRLLRDGQSVFTGKHLPVELGSQRDWRHVAVVGKLKLGTDMGPGEYVLQVIITDRLAKEKYSSMSQWIDFEIVK